MNDFLKYISVTATAAQEPFSQENRRPLLNDCFRARWAEKCPNWTSIGNDRFGKLDGSFWLTMSDRTLQTCRWFIPQPSPKRI
jgi:hypothetical protein